MTTPPPETPETPENQGNPTPGAQTAHTPPPAQLKEEVVADLKEERKGDDPKPDEAVHTDLKHPSTWLPTVIETAIAIVMALVIGAILIALSDEKVLQSLPYVFSYPADFFSRSWDAISTSYLALVKGALAPDRIPVTLVRAAPLICAGLGVSLAFRAGLFNIGAQGQLMMGALVAGYIGFTWHLPPVIHMLVALVGGVVAGGLWGAIAGFLKARTGAHEVITTIMLNYLGASVLLYALGKEAFQRPGRDDRQSPPPLDSATFGGLGDFHYGVLLALVAAALCWWLLERSKLGFELRAVGANPQAARTAGMNVEKAFTVAMLIAGALAGLAATMTVLGEGNSLSTTLAGTIGFDAITVALLGRATPLGTVLAGLLFGALSTGGVAMQASAAHTPKELTQVLQALIVLFVAAPILVRNIARLKGSGGDSGMEAKGWGG